MQINPQNYGDKELLTDALSSEKAITSNYNLSANECACPQLRDTMMRLLNDEHDIQFDVFNEMHSRGFYPTPMAEMQKVQQARQQFQPKARQPQSC